MGNNTFAGAGELSSLYSDTYLGMTDIAPEFVAFTILWHDMGYGNDPAEAIEATDAHMLTLPYVLAIRERLRKDGRWPEERNLKNLGLLSATLMIEAAKIDAPLLRYMRDLLTVEMAANGIFG